MFLRHISILNYKNIREVELAFSPKINCFIGANGVGKTNLLDAIYYLSFCRSAATAIDASVIRHDDDFFVLQGTYGRQDGEDDIQVYCGLKRRHKKQFRLGKKEYKRLSEHIGLIPLVIISPADTELINGGSEERRRFMDVVISQYDKPYMEALMQYEKALQQRNALLKQEEEPDGSMMAVYEELMACQGEKIFRKRTDFIARFLPSFERIYQEISGGKEAVSLAYASHGQRGDLLEIIRRDRAKDRIMGYSLHGVHKDELAMCLGGFPIRREGSQGQNKTFLIALKLAQFDFLKQASDGHTPILLLDDIFDKLDATRVEQIVRLVAGEQFGQIFITDTNRHHLDLILSRTGNDYRLYHVNEGGVVG